MKSEPERRTASRRPARIHLIGGCPHFGPEHILSVNIYNRCCFDIKTVQTHLQSADFELSEDFDGRCTSFFKLQGMINIKSIKLKKSYSSHLKTCTERFMYDRLLEKIRQKHLVSIVLDFVGSVHSLVQD